MHAVAFNHPLVEYTVKEIEAKIEEERGSGSGYKDCFNFKNDLKTGQVCSKHRKTSQGIVLTSLTSIQAHIDRDGHSGLSAAHWSEVCGLP